MRSVHTMWRVCALAVLVVSSVACGNNNDIDGGAPAASAPASSAVTDVPDVTDVADVADALRFTSPLVGGSSIDGASLAGRPAVLWFWAPT